MAGPEPGPVVLHFHAPLSSALLPWFPRPSTVYGLSGMYCGGMGALPRASVSSPASAPDGSGGSGALRTSRRACTRTAARPASPPAARLPPMRHRCAHRPSPRVQSPAPTVGPVLTPCPRLGSAPLCVAPRLSGGLPSSPAGGVRVRLASSPHEDTGEEQGGAGGWARVQSGFIFPIPLWPHQIASPMWH
jgi:hypothetical protein